MPSSNEVSPDAANGSTISVQLEKKTGRGGGSGKGRPPGLHTPHMLIPDVEDIIIGSIRIGLTIQRACALAKISPSTYYKWQKRSLEDPDSQEGQFIARVKEAEAKWAKEVVGVIHKDITVNENSDLALKMLSKRLPEDYGDKKEIINTNINIELSQQTEIKIDQMIDRLSTEELDALTRRLLIPGPTDASGIQPEVIEGQWTEETSSLHQVPVPRIPTYTT